MKLSRTMLAMAALTGLAGLSLHSAHAAPPPYSIVTGTGAAGQDQGTFSGTSGTIPELGLNWAVTATSPATQQYHVYNGVQTWTFTQGGSPAVVNLAFAISGVDAWTTDNSTNPASTVREAMGLPVGTVCNISNPAYVFPAGATDGTPGSPIFSWTPDNGAGMAVLRYLGGPGGPVNRYNQYPAVPCTYTGSQLVLTGAGFRGNEVGGTSFWHGLAYLRVLNSPSAAASPVPAMDILGLGAMTVLLGGVGSLVARRRRKQG